MSSEVVVVARWSLNVVVIWMPFLLGAYAAVSLLELSINGLGCVRLPSLCEERDVAHHLRSIRLLIPPPLESIGDALA